MKRFFFELYSLPGSIIIWLNFLKPKKGKLGVSRRHKENRHILAPLFSTIIYVVLGLFIQIALAPSEDADSTGLSSPSKSEPFTEEFSPQENQSDDSHAGSAKSEIDAQNLREPAKVNHEEGNGNQSTIVEESTEKEVGKPTNLNKPAKLSPSDLPESPFKKRK